MDSARLKEWFEQMDSDEASPYNNCCQSCDSESDDAFEFSSDEEGVWEARTASMALIHMLVNSPEALEDRILAAKDSRRRSRSASENSLTMGMSPRFHIRTFCTNSRSHHLRNPPRLF
ncbi:hypothetical protein C8R47DRAFT_1226122 [Mycena vitilis]|nr:hypothetical protein C8R47DRAFT_1226122 [Mycena vitilis]